jgi:hypothetical protein
MISLKNYRGKRGIKSRGQRKEEKKKRKNCYTKPWDGEVTEKNQIMP